jgi:hypothetical protein
LFRLGLKTKPSGGGGALFPEGGKKSVPVPGPARPAACFAAQSFKGGKTLLSCTQGRKAGLEAEFFMVGCGRKEQYGKARVEGLETGQAEVGDQKVVGGKFFPEAGDKFPAAVLRRQIAAGTEEFYFGIFRKP